MCFCADRLTDTVLQQEIGRDEYTADADGEVQRFACLGHDLACRNDVAYALRARRQTAVIADHAQPVIDGDDLPQHGQLARKDDRPARAGLHVGAGSVVNAALADQRAALAAALQQQLRAEARPRRARDRRGEGRPGVQADPSVLRLRDAAQRGCAFVQRFVRKRSARPSGPASRRRYRPRRFSVRRAR